MSQLFVGIITVVRVCRSGTGCFGLLRLQSRVGVGASEGSKNGVMVYHPRRNRVSAFAAKYREIHGLHWNKVSRERGGRKQRGKKASEKRPTAWRDMLRIELQRVVALFPFPPPRVLSRLDRPYGIPVSVRVGALAPV